MKINVGFPRIHRESNEVRDFLPNLISHVERWGGNVILENGYGSGMGLGKNDYLRTAPSVRFGAIDEVYQQDLVIVLRYPHEEYIRLMHPGACLISMLHYPTRPVRVDFLKSLNIEAISLDSIKDDTGRRLIENLRMVAWNGVQTAFRVLRSTYPNPGFDSPQRPPIRVTLMGAGGVGMHVVQAAIRYGNEKDWHNMISKGIPGVQVTVVDLDLTGQDSLMQAILSQTDLLVDATSRPEPVTPVIPNDWIGLMPAHAVLLDLSVDPYDCESIPGQVKGIEGIPHGDLDKYVFPPDDPVYNQLPECISRIHRRYAVSCYSWPGINPKKCMDIYGKQIAPILRTLIVSGGTRAINPERTYFHRAISRAFLSNWSKTS